MLYVLVTIQTLVTLMCLASVLVVVFQKTSSYSNIIVITFLCSFVQNGSYILEMMAKSAEEAMIAVKTEYLGGAFEVSLLTFFIFKYCGHEFKKFFKGILIFEGVAVLCGVWSWEYTGLYYTGMSFVADAKIPHLVLQHGWLYFAFAGTTLIELIACIFILVVSILKTNQEHMKNNYNILLGVVLIPLAGFLISLAGLLQGFDLTPISCGVSVSIFAFAIARNRVFDVADAAGELILANMDNAIVIKNNEDGYEYSNNRAKELFPVLKDYSKGNIIKDVELKKIFDKTRNNSIEINKKIFNVTISDVKVRGEEIGTTSVLFDVTESNKQIEQMKQLTEDARRANKSKTEFLESISQEIKSPINVIMGMNEVMLRNYCTDETKEYLLNIKNSGTALLNLISDILDFSKIETGKMGLSNEQFNMKEMISEIVSIYDFRCTQKGLVFEHEISSDIPKYVLGDETKVKQIFNTLLSNSTKYTANGFVRFKLGIKYRSDFDIDLFIAVEDSGEGISEKDQQILFADFDGSGDKTGYTNETTGLSLINVKNIVDLMGGIINFKSEVGSGSAFSIVIPLQKTKDSNETIEDVNINVDNSEIYKVPFTCKRAEILVVDDSDVAIMITTELLKDTQAKVTAVRTGEECLEKVEKKHYDIIFMDYKMSEMDGIETLSRMKQHTNKCTDTPVILHTANIKPDMKKQFQAKGFSDVLVKPAMLEQLVTMLYKWLPEELIERK